MQDLNPLLSEDACRKLLKLCQLWQAHCVLLDKVTRCLQQLHAVSSTTTDVDSSRNIREFVAAELDSQRNWDYSHYRQWLAFEVLQRLQIRPVQYTVAKQLLDNQGGDGLSESDRGAILKVTLPHCYGSS